MEHQIIDDSQDDLTVQAEDAEKDEEIRNELEHILNIEMLSNAPFSLVNLTENLFPLNIHSTKQNLILILEQYKNSPESYELLE